MKNKAIALNKWRIKYSDPKVNFFVRGTVMGTPARSGA